MLELLGLDPFGVRDEQQVAILVGPNGAGKSTFLRDLARDIRYSRNLAVICNTAFDRFAGMRGIKRVSAGRTARSPKTVVKAAIQDTLDDEDGRFYQISKILEHCGYKGSIGFKVKAFDRKFLDRDILLEAGGDPRDVDLALSFLQRYDLGEILWVGDRERLLDYSQGREFASVLRLESILRKASYVRDIEVYLVRIDGPVIELQSASSGELVLISSLLFLVANRDHNPVILVDEPENSLHPSWQRQYVDKLLDALEYRSATVIIATHAPLVVTGALANARNVVSVFQIDHGDANRIDLVRSGSSTESIEEILWRAFDVITPASHYVSQELVGVVSRVEQGEMGADRALAFVDEMDNGSFDDQQHAFFGAVRELIGRVAAERDREANDA